MGGGCAFFTEAWPPVEAIVCVDALLLVEDPPSPTLGPVLPEVAGAIEASHGWIMQSWQPALPAARSWRMRVQCA